VKENAMARPYFERVLLVAGDRNAGKGTQLRSMFLDPRLSDHRIGPGGTIPASRNIPDTYKLSFGRRLYLRLTSPHEAGESLDEFFTKIRGKAVSGRWCVASAFQITATRRTPDLLAAVRAIDGRLSPERIRVCILSPDRRGGVLPDAPQLAVDLRQVASCEVMAINAEDRRANGLLRADTFDFT
jgi:hypothetical protein